MDIIFHKTWLKSHRVADESLAARWALRLRACNSPDYWGALARRLFCSGPPPTTPALEEVLEGGWGTCDNFKWMLTLVWVNAWFEFVINLQEIGWRTFQSSAVI
ncbi:unnamed protein product [Allacma fusca]|uniref:Uncharacterized protein n=1 Tax=Allacma fusca TaxID=39272 RepID=A0A8J2K010_9HEXA|nr:unnamed protein product [Allacma fusca]